MGFLLQGNAYRAGDFAYVGTMLVYLFEDSAVLDEQEVSVTHQMSPGALPAELLAVQQLLIQHPIGV